MAALAGQPAAKAQAGPRRNPKLANKLERIMEQTCCSELVFQVQGVSDVFHQTGGFIEVGRLVQAPDAVFFSKLTMVYKLHSSLVAEPQNWKALGNLLPVLVNILLFLWDLPEDVPKPKPAETELRPRPRGRGRGTETKKEKGQVAPKVAASPPKAWHCIFWFLTTHWKDRCFNFLSCMEMFLISGTFKHVV